MMVVEGVVEHGDARGRTIGFPTANLPLPDAGIDAGIGAEVGAGSGKAVEDGVWAALVRTGSGEWRVAAVSVGRRRTFYTGGGHRLLEAHLLDFHGDLYGQALRVELAAKLRDQQSFPGVQALTAQLRRDVEDTRRWAAGHCPWLLAPQERRAAVGELV